MILIMHGLFKVEPEMKQMMVLTDLHIRINKIEIPVLET